MAFWQRHVSRDSYGSPYHSPITTYSPSSTPNARAASSYAASPSRSPGEFAKSSARRGSSSIGYQIQSCCCSTRSVHLHGQGEYWYYAVAKEEAEWCKRLSRWQLGLMFWSAFALWWFGMHAIGVKWDWGENDGPFSSEDILIVPNTQDWYKRRSLMDAASSANVTLRQPGEPLGVCLMSADFWGSPTAGGTATAYHLLAQVLASDPNFRVTFLGVTKKVTDCEQGIRYNAAASQLNLNFTCLRKEHFVPAVVETEPYEQLSHAVVAWVRENIQRCDILHGHEWGGLFVKLATLDNYRQLKPGLRFVIEPHGGHFWSTQGQLQRPLDITSLRIDHGERMTLALASALISPTHYMTAFLAQRGWRLPQENIVIPNVVPVAEEASHVGQRKPVWRLAFFSRLEERKGLKLFVEAINKLVAARYAFSERFEVYFVGAEAQIDMRASSEWLAEKTSQWRFPVHIKVNVKRDEALQLLSEEGMLLVLCSLIDNMPYVVAEASVKGVPFLVFDVGGTLEMFDPETNAEAVVWEPTIDALYSALLRTMTRGDLKTVELSNQVTSGSEQWLAWHSNFASSRITLLQQADKELAGRAAGTKLGKLVVQNIPAGTKSLELWKTLCLPRESPDTALLLLPEEYSLLRPESANATLVELLQLGGLRGNGIGALTFGAQVLMEKVAFPSSPTWIMYSGDEARCIDDVPVLLRRRTFCDAYLAEARVFRAYHSWVLSMLLIQAGWRLHTYPEVMFKAEKFSTVGTTCMPDRPPSERHLDFNKASNLYADAEEVMVNLHLAPFPKPTSSIVEDFPTEQNHKGWQVGYLLANDPGLRLLDFWLPESGEAKDGRWACAPEDTAYPAMQHSLVHPCAGGGISCCGFPTAPIVTRFNSYFASKHAALIMAYEVWPICGDGVDMEIALTSKGPRGQFRHTFLRQGFEASQHETPQRQKVEFRFELHVDDWVDFIIWPRATHDCDGIYVVDMQMWEDNGTKKRSHHQEASEGHQQNSQNKAAVGDLMAGDEDAYRAAAQGKGALAQQTARSESGALEGAKAQQGEIRRRSLQAINHLQGDDERMKAESAGPGTDSPLLGYWLVDEEPKGLGYRLGSTREEQYESWRKSLEFQHKAGDT